MIVFNCLFPIFALILTGMVLRRHLPDAAAFFRTSDRLVYFGFFPALLFWKIGGGDGSFVDRDLIYAALAALAVVFVLSTLFILKFVPAGEAGSFSQACYRFNTYAGMAIIMSVSGDEGVRRFGALIAVLIPVINILAVATLVWFSGESGSLFRRINSAAAALIKNPLLLACVAGMAYSRFFPPFPTAVDSFLSLSSRAALPMALLSIGNALTLKSLKGFLAPSVWSAVFKLMILPLAGWYFLRFFGVPPDAFLTGMIFFSLPASSAIHVLSGQLGSSVELASAAVMLSTALSLISLSFTLWLWG